MAGILIDEAVLAEIRNMPCCLCRKFGGDWNRIQAHHVVKRALAGGSRFDHRLNLLPVHALHCHEMVDGFPKRVQFAFVAHRENMSVEAVENFVLDHTSRKFRVDDQADAG